MDLKHIRYFVAVAEAGSFTAAARLAFVSQPTLSAAIQALERDVGETLFERGTKGVALTPAGERRLPEAQDILRACAAFKDASPTKHPAKRARIGVSPTIPPAFVSRAVHDLVDEFGLDDWKAEAATTDVLERRLLAGRLDAVLAPIGAPSLDERSRMLMRDRLALAVPRGAALSEPLTPRVLHKVPLIVRTHCEYLRPASRILDGLGVAPVVVARIDNDLLALSMVAQGLGSCLMPDSYADNEVRFVRPAGVDLPRTIGWRWLRAGKLAKWN